ncbi:DotA/TraY family protein [Thiotrichales bacterium 19X7-9]|nr:DotA/TraY family protein [Thiotrichales bacterium 19X7-9]
MGSENNFFSSLWEKIADNAWLLETHSQSAQGSSTDRSQDILQSIFGVNIHNMLSHSEPLSLFSSLFKSFNSGLLAIAFILYAFIIIVGTINTARDGQFLGKQWSGHWISLRAIFGTLAAIPFKTGYCIAQYLILYLVLAGVSFADYLWSNIVSDVVENKIPPVVSTEVSSNIKNFLATYMLSNLTTDLIADGEFVRPAGPPSPSDVDMPCLLTSENRVMCQMKFNTRISSSFVKAYYKKLAQAENNGKFPFENYAGALGQGLPYLSKINGDTYVQYQLNTADWIGNLTLNQMIDQPNKNHINEIISKYSLDTPVSDPSPPSADSQIKPIDYGNHKPSYLTVNLVENYNALKSYSDMAMEGTATDIIHWLESKSATISGRCSDNQTKNDDDYLEENDICFKAKNYGWWYADELYLDFDNTLSKNLQNLYVNFAKFSEAANNVSGKRSLPINYSKININYTRKDHNIKDLLKKYELNEDNIKISFDKPKDHKATAKINLTNEDELNNIGSFTTSMESMRDLFNLILSESGNNNKDLRKKVDFLLVDGMKFQYTKYLYIIYSIANAARDAGISNDILIKKIIMPVINLLEFFNNNNVHFGLDKSSVDTKRVTDPAKQLLTTIFDKLGTNTSSAEPGTMLYSIYHIGEVPDHTTKVGTDDFAAKNFSMIQNVQAVGMSLLEGSINSMLGVFSHAQSELEKIQDYAEAKTSNAEGNALGYGIGGAILPLWQGTFQAQTNLEYAEVMFDVTMKLATFSLSLIWLPLVLFVLSSIFSIAITFSLIIPLTPYILFWAGKTAWLLLVIEAMVAAPFVALGLIYPEGHEVFGKSEPAIQIAMNLVLRPAFMIVGMICAIGLTYIIIDYSAAGFHAVVDSLLNLMPASNGTDAGTYARGTFTCMIIFLYATFITMAFMKCFSLIYVLPDKVLQWIGNTRSERTGEAEIQEFKSAGTQYAQGAAQAGGQSLTQGIEAEKSYTQSHNQGTMDVSKATSERNSAIAKDTSNTAQEIGKTIMI